MQKNILLSKISKQSFSLKKYMDTMIFMRMVVTKKYI